MKRFYTTVEVAAADAGHRVLLDGRPLRTPARQRAGAAVRGARRGAGRGMARPGRDARAARHAADPARQHRAGSHARLSARAAIEEVAGYARTDLLCYRAAHPLDLVLRQQHGWQPLLDWAAATFGARLAVTTALLPVAQPEAAVARLRAEVEALGDWPLVGLHAATTALGSLVLGLALARGRIDAQQALAASLLDELFEIERWGKDDETERRHDALARDVDAAAAFLDRLARRRVRPG